MGNGTRTRGSDFQLERSVPQVNDSLLNHAVNAMVQDSNPACAPRGAYPESETGTILHPKNQMPRSFAYSQPQTSRGNRARYRERIVSEYWLRPHNSLFRCDGDVTQLAAQKKEDAKERIPLARAPESQDTTLYSHP